MKIKSAIPVTLVPAHVPTIGKVSSSEPQNYITGERIIRSIRSFVEKNPDRAPLMEVFYTAEGEGNFIGIPRILVRLGGCAVGCTWCDTKHSWKISSQWEIACVDDVVSEVEAASNYGKNTRHISITGGEPLHYPDFVYDLAKQLRGKGYFVSVETSGLIFVPNVFNMLHYVSMDIKTPSSGIELTPSFLTEYQHLAENHPGAQFKAVILDHGDLAFVSGQLRFLYSTNPMMRSPLILTPGVKNTKSTANLSEKLNEVVQMILQWNEGYNIRVIAQQHALLSYR